MKKSKLRKIIPVIMSAALALNPVGAGTASAAKKPALNKKKPGNYSWTKNYFESKKQNKRSIL